MRAQEARAQANAKTKGTRGHGETERKKQRGSGRHRAATGRPCLPRLRGSFRPLPDSASVVQEPVHGCPLRVNSSGSEFLFCQEARKPKERVPLAATDLL